MKMTLRKCTSCGISKNEGHFYRYRKDKGLMRKCKECCSISYAQRHAEMSEELREKNREYYHENKERVNKNRKQRRNSDWSSKIKHLLRNAEQRAKTKGWDFDLCFDFVLAKLQEQCGNCYYSGRALSLTGKEAISLDRKDPSKGYTKDNVNLVCLSVNYMKRDISHENFINLCHEVGGRF